MREKVIAYSVVCCFVLGAIYVKNKVFAKKLPVDEVVEEPSEVKEGDQK